MWNTNPFKTPSQSVPASQGIQLRMKAKTRKMRKTRKMWAVIATKMASHP
jgi:hypothetical protein